MCVRWQRVQWACVVSICLSVDYRHVLRGVLWAKLRAWGFTYILS